MQPSDRLMESQLPKVGSGNLLAVLLEDYFHVGAFNQLIQSGQWYRFAARYEQNTLTTLDLLDRFNTKATFFVLGWIGEQNPDLLREVARRGHEIASRGYYNRDIHHMTPDEFRDDLKRTRDVLESATGQPVSGHRAASPWRLHTDRWALEILAASGYAYDTSVMLRGRVPHPMPGESLACELQFQHNSIWEFPVSTCNVFGWRLPVSGGNYFRQFPHRLMQRAVAQWHTANDAPFVMYFHVWEMDRTQPRISGASALQRLRHYRNLGKMWWVMEDYLSRYQFEPFAQFLKLNYQGASQQLPQKNASTSLSVTASPAEPAASARLPVTIVIPCFNEELILPYLDNTLRSVEAQPHSRYEFRFIFVDDCSTDGTNEALRRLFGQRPNVRIHRHPHNRGVAAAIMTGIGLAETEIVCSMDCDCTYDPHELLRMIPLLTEGVDMVTASPYHPLGQVRNVPPWRLTLSKGASFLYRQVLNQKLATYTSCFRVYRRKALADLTLREDGFLGVAEMLGRLDLRGAQIVEYPATLEVRLFGRSKMKLLKTILGHLQLLARLLRMRLFHTEKATGSTKNLTKNDLSGTAPAAGNRR